MVLFLKTEGTHSFSTSSGSPSYHITVQPYLKELSEIQNNMVNQYFLEGTLKWGVKENSI